VIAAASSRAKLEVAAQKGAHHLIDLREEDLRKRVLELTEGRGIDVCIDPVGGSFAEPLVRSMAWNGRYLVVGFAAGEIPKIPLNLVLLKGCACIGVFWGAFREREPTLAAANDKQLLEWLHSGALSPFVSEVVPLERGGTALARLRDRQAMGKLVVKVKTAGAGA
jgi:NADPH:quinone reductase